MNTPVYTSRSKIHPIMIITAIAIILVCIAGVAALMGWLPTSNTRMDNSTSPTAVKPATQTAKTGHSSSGNTSAPIVVASNKPIVAKCADCGTVESVNAMEVAGQSNGTGAVIGGVLGGVLGHQVGGGRGKDVATVAGAVGGALAGNAIEKNRNASTRYQVRVRLDDGSFRTITVNSATSVQAGDRVRVEGDSFSRL